MPKIPFSKQISEIRRGDLDAELTDALAECVREVDQRGGSATLTIKITVKRAGKNDGYMKVLANYSTKLPKQEPTETILFALPDGALWSDDPRQGNVFDEAPRVEVRPSPNIKQVVQPSKAETIIVDRNTAEVIEVKKEA